MISINFVFWLFVLLFGIIGMMRGWAKELLVTFSVILALAFNSLLMRYVPMFKALPPTELPLFWIRLTLVISLVFFGYQTVGLSHFAAKVIREKLQDSLLGFVLGAINGTLIVGTIWYYLIEANYPFPDYITPPVPGTPMGDAAAQMLPWLAPRLMGEPTIYFAVMICFIFVLVVFI